MADRISVSVSELERQATELRMLNERLSSVSNRANHAVALVQDALSSKFSSNMNEKGKKLVSNLDSLSDSLCQGADIADNCAKTYQSVDASVRDMIGESLPESIIGAVRSAQQSDGKAGAFISEPVAKWEEVDVGDYCSKITAAEYARLCRHAYTAIKNGDVAASFVNAIKKDTYIPENDPIKKLSSGQISVERNLETGYEAITIFDGNTAMVIFVGTNEDMGDYIADAQLATGQASAQSRRANEYIGELSKKYSNIIVTGHSLGGYLATSVTLNHDAVSKCITFDPPGRYDVKSQKRLNSGRVAKITTYEAIGSIISSVGEGINVIKLPVESNGSFLAYNHGLNEITNALGGKSTIYNSWNKCVCYPAGREEVSDAHGTGGGGSR